MLHRPVDEILESGKPNFPFCLCWANENWTRRWDGAEHDILIAQEHSEENNQAFAESLVPFLRDPRYIQVNGRPLILVYRADILPEVLRTTEQWRNVFRKNGIDEVHLCAALTFDLSIEDLDKIGFDSGVEFPPHQVPPKLIDPVQLGMSDHKGYIYDFEGVVTHSLSSPMPTKQKKYLTVMTGWDNTARKGKASNIFINANPENYELWLRGAVEKTQQRYIGDERLVFVNAWNEWAEGTHLEPDRKYGHSYLSATARALSGACDWKVIIQLLYHLGCQDRENLKRYLVVLEQKINEFKEMLSSQINKCFKINKKYLSVKKMQLKNQDINPAHIERPVSGGKIYSSNSSLDISGWTFNQQGKKVTGVSIVDNGKPIKTIPVDRNRGDIYQVYKELGFQNLESQTIGFTGSVKVKDILKQQDEYYMSLCAIIQDSPPIEIADIHVRLIEEEENRKVGRKLKLKARWYNNTIDDVEQTLLDLSQTNLNNSDFKEALDHIKDILAQWETLNIYLNDFISAEG